MKVQYTFRINGLLRLDNRDLMTFNLNDVTYEVRAEKKRISELSITYHDVPEDHWPLMTENPEPGIAFNLKERFSLAHPRQVAKNFADLMSVFGCDGIDESYSKVKWIAESPSEEEKLDMLEGTLEHVPRTVEDMEPTPEGLIYQAIASADQDGSEELELAFFRRGIAATQERRYIESFYHYFFIVETNFAQGKFKSKEVKQNFLSSADLVQDIRDVIRELPNSLVGLPKDLAHKVLSLYQDKDPIYVVNRIVDRRGFLHHHTRLDKGRWHPDRAEEFQPDAYLLQLIAHKSVWRVVSRRLWSPRVLHICSNLSVVQDGLRKKSPA